MMTSAIDIAHIAHALGGAVRDGKGWRCRCPVHGGAGPNLNLQPGDAVPLLATCWSRGCDPRDVLVELRHRGLLDDDRSDLSRRRDTARPTRAKVRPADIELPDDEAQQRIDRVLNRTVPLKGSTGARWLRDIRGLEPELLDEEAVLFLSGTDRFPPGIVSVITAWTDASIVLGLQFTALSPDGSQKLWRKFMTGSKPGGGVCRLVNDAELTRDLAIGEGLETCLAAMTAQYRARHMVRPAWAALSAGNFANLNPLPAIERLMLLVDADDAGRKGAEKCAALWHHAGREVRIAAPTAGTDWNDAT